MILLLMLEENYYLFISRRKQPQRNPRFFEKIDQMYWGQVAASLETVGSVWNSGKSESILIQFLTKSYS